jgi:hypothetical protein
LANGKFSDFFSSILPFILIVSDRLYALIFDGTPHIGELLGVIARFVDEECEVHQILLGVVHADKALNSAQLGGLTLATPRTYSFTVSTSLSAISPKF